MTQRTLHLAAGLALPLETVTQAIGIVAKRRAGKSYTASQVAILTAYAVNGGGFNNYLSALRTRGWIEGRRECLRITALGIEQIGPITPLPSGPDLLELWKERLGKAERSALEVLVSAYPRSLSRELVATAAGYAPDGGGFNNALSRLRTLELIEGDRGGLRAAEELIV